MLDLQATMKALFQELQPRGKIGNGQSTQGPIPTQIQRSTTGHYSRVPLLPHQGTATRQGQGFLIFSRSFLPAIHRPSPSYSGKETRSQTSPVGTSMQSDCLPLGISILGTLHAPRNQICVPYSQGTTDRPAELGPPGSYPTQGHFAQTIGLSFLTKTGGCRQRTCRPHTPKSSQTRSF